MPSSFEPPHIHPFGDLRFIVGSEIPPVSIRVAFPEMRRLVIIRGVIVVIQFEGSEAAPCIDGQRLLDESSGIL